MESQTETQPSVSRGKVISEIQAVRNLLDKANAARELSINELRENEERYRNLFEAANVGKSRMLLSGEINVNKAFCDMLGYQKKELRNKTWQQLTPPEDVERIEEKLASLLKGEKKAVRFEKRYIHKSGSYVWTDVNITIQRDPNGKPLYFITTVVDITERKQAEQELLHSEQQLSNAMKMARLGHWELDVADGMFTFSDSFYAILPHDC